jgi:hypothetical protein
LFARIRFFNTRRDFARSASQTLPPGPAQFCVTSAFAKRRFHTSRQIARIDRLLHPGPAAPLLRQIVLAIAGNKHKGNVAFREFAGHWEDARPRDVDI